MIDIEVTVYLDIVFVINFIFDFIGIILTAAVADVHTKRYRYALAACVYAVIDVVALVSGIYDKGWLFLLLYALVEFLCIGICFYKVCIKKYLLLISLHMGIIFTMGGMMTSIFNNAKVMNKEASMVKLIIIGVLVYALLKYMMPYIIKSIYYRERIYRVTIKLRNREITMKGLLDTGNTLREKSTGKQVTIVEKDILKKMYDMPIEKIYVIPYKSVGRDDGVLYGIRVDELIITHEKFEKVAYDAIIGIYHGKLSSDNRYNAILHGQCLM